MPRIATFIVIAGIAALLGGAGALAFGAGGATPEPERPVVTQTSDENGVAADDDDGTADQGRGDAPGTAGAGKRRRRHGRPGPR